MKRYRCKKCGMVFEGKLSICPGCGTELHYMDQEIKLQSESAINENSVSSFRFDDDDVIKTGIPEDESELPTVQEQFFNSMKAKGAPKGNDVVLRGKSSRYTQEQLLSPELSYFDGTKFAGALLHIAAFLMSVATAFILVPVAATMIYRWDAKHTVLCGHRLGFDGTAKQLFGRYILWLFLTIITATIFSIWLTHFLKKWKIKHTVILKDKVE